MPLVLSKSLNEHCHFMVWESAESNSYFEALLGPYIRQNQELQSITNVSKQKEWLASRFLLKHLAQKLTIPFKGIEKDEFGKPWLIDSNVYISLSHTQTHVAACIHKTANVGIDLEKVSPRLKIIEYKFLTELERNLCAGDLEKLTILWSAKEAMYKLDGKRGIHFQKELLIYAIENNFLEAEIKTAIPQKVSVYFEKLENSYLTIAMEKLS
jgi:4'-phosphopantetheinyl transferase